jgi:homoaconitate hydratase
VGISATNRNFKGRMGSRDAQCYLASPEVVAASAAAGHITGPKGANGSRPAWSFVETLPDAPVEGESVSILPGFPEKLSGRLVFVPQDNLNTDGIYGKDYTYREDMTPADMARVVMENYDPDFAASTEEGDILVGGWNFGTGSSREQAATALQAKGIALLIAGSFSQTYLRNAYNNGFICIECPELVVRLKEGMHAAVQAGELTIISEVEVAIDFSNGTITHGTDVFRFPPLGSVPQSLVVAGGSEPLIRQRIGLA